MRYAVLGRSTKHLMWMGEALSSEQAIQLALAFMGEPFEAFEFYTSLLITKATDITEQALKWAETQDQQEAGIESMVDLLISYAEEQSLFLDWTDFEEE